MRQQSDFRAVVEAHQRMVYGIALRLLGERGEAEEVAQDVFLALYDAMDGLADEAHVTFWLRRVAVHRATDALRRRRVRPVALAEEWDEAAHAPVAELEEQGGMGAWLEQMVHALPEPYRTTVVLRYAEEASPQEIAAILERPLATVKSHLQRGLGMLRAKALLMTKERTR